MSLTIVPERGKRSGAWERSGSATACFTLLEKPTHHLYAPRFLSNTKHFLKLRGCGTGGSTLARPQRIKFVARTLSAEAPRSTTWRFRAAAAGPSK